MPYLFLTLSMFIVGSNVAIGKLIVTDFPVFLFSFLRFFIATSLLALGFLKRDFKVDLGHPNIWKGLFLQSFFGCFLFSIFMLYGVFYTSSINASIITSILPSLILILAWIWLKEKLSINKVLAVIFAIMGIIILNFQKGVLVDSANLLGNILVLCAVLSEAIFAVISRYLSVRISPLSIAFAVNFIGFLLFLPLALPQANIVDWSSITVDIWLYIFYYSVTASILSFIFWYRGIAKVPASIAGLFTGLVPISAMLTGFIILNETISLEQTIGMIFIIFALCLGVKIHKKE